MLVTRTHAWGTRTYAWDTYVRMGHVRTPGTRTYAWDTYVRLGHVRTPGAFLEHFRFAKLVIAFSCRIEIFPRYTEKVR